MEIVPGAPPPEDTPDEETVECQKPDLACTPDATKRYVHRQGITVRKVGGESIWRSNWIVQQASEVLRTMEFMASIAVSIQLSTSSSIQPTNKPVHGSTSEGSTGLLHYRIISISRCPAKSPL